MNNDNTLDRVLVACTRLESVSDELTQTAKEVQAAIRATRECEQAQLGQALQALFEEQRQRTEAALRPKVARAWQVLAALAGVGVLVFGGFWLLIDRADDREEVAQARADAAEVRAEVQEASRHVEITSCACRPCIRIDENTPTWKSGSTEYILVDGKPGKATGKRR